jgi:membrane-associated phospholipid phosphatase
VAGAEDGAVLAWVKRHDVQLPEVVWAFAMAVWLVLILVAWLGCGMPQGPKYLAVNLSAGAAILALRPAMLRAPGGVLRVLRWWYPVLFYGVMFMETGPMVPAIHPHDFDAELGAIDRFLFGVNPTVWLQKVHHPLLSEYLQLCYAAYYFLPLAAGAQLIRRRGTRAFSDGLAVISLAFYGSYLCYFFVPSIGPRFTIPHDTLLHGLWTFDAVHHFLAGAEGRMHDCFPSGHTAITIIALIYAWRAHRPTFFALLPVGLGLIFSTVYLRYHYVIDLLAALPFVGLTFLVGVPMTRAWNRWRGLDVPPDGGPAPASRAQAQPLESGNPL